MKKLRIYCDTSVIGGCFDREFAPWSNALMDDFATGSFVPVLSELVAAEIRPAPEPVRAKHAALIEQGAEYLTITAETLDVALAYEAHGSAAAEPSQRHAPHLAGDGRGCGRAGKLEL